MPKYEMSLTITIKDAGPEDVLGLVGRIGEMAERGTLHVDAATGKALRQLTAVKRKDWGAKIHAAITALEQCGNDRCLAAERLGISKITLDEWLRKGRDMAGGDGIE